MGEKRPRIKRGRRGREACAKIVSDHSRSREGGIPLRRIASSLRALAVSALALVVIPACAVPSRPVAYDSSGEPATTDGLYRLRASRVAGVFARPGASLSGYEAILIDPVSVSYKDEPRPASTMSRSRGNYALDDAGMERLKQIYRESLERELTRREAFTVAHEAGPGVLRVTGHIVNLVVNVPPMRGGERDFVFDAGEMTLVLDVRDSRSDEPLMRIVDRRAIRPGSTSLAGAYESGPVTNTGALRDLFFEWALVLRDWIDLLQANPVPPAPAANAQG